MQCEEDEDPRESPRIESLAKKFSETRPETTLTDLDSDLTGLGTDSDFTDLDSDSDPPKTMPAAAKKRAPKKPAATPKNRTIQKTKKSEISKKPRELPIKQFRQKLQDLMKKCPKQ